jgi:hypothetical protein
MADAKLKEVCIANKAKHTLRNTRTKFYIISSFCLSQMGLTDDPSCERCLEEDESATHILCDCEAIANLIFRHLGQFFTEPNDYFDASIKTVLHFIRSVGLIKG